MNTDENVIRVVTGPIEMLNRKRPIILHCSETTLASEKRLKIDFEFRPIDLPFRSNEFRLLFLKIRIGARFPSGVVLQVEPRRELSKQSVELVTEASRESQLGFELGPNVAEKVIEIAGQLAAHRKWEHKTSATTTAPLLDVSGESGDNEEEAAWHLQFISPKQWLKWGAQGASGINDAVDKYRGWEPLSATASVPKSASITSVWASILPESLFLIYQNSTAHWGQFLASLWITAAARRHFRALLSSLGNTPLVSCTMGEPPNEPNDKA